MALLRGGGLSLVVTCRTADSLRPWPWSRAVTCEQVQIWAGAYQCWWDHLPWQHKVSKYPCSFMQRPISLIRTA